MEVPAGWYVVPFASSDGKATARGAQVSNVKLPSPSVMAGYPIQTNEHDLPPGGIALIVATFEDPGVSQDPTVSLPLASPYASKNGWSVGSALPDQPYMSLVWFTGNGQTFIASVKTGPNAAQADQMALGGIVTSLHF